MRRLSLLLCMIMIFVACNNQTNKIEDSNLDEKKVDLEPKNSVLKNKKIDESRLRKVVQKYLNSILNFDIDVTIDYMHPIQLEVFKLKFDGNNNINSIKTKVRQIYQEANIKQMNQEYNMKITFGNLIDSISYKNDVIYILDYERTGENKFDKVYEKSILIAVTSDYGNTWKFIGAGKEFADKRESLLLNIYPTIIVDEIFDIVNSSTEVKTSDDVFAPVDEKERILQRDFIEYTNAFYNGNADKAISYIFIGVFEHLKEIFQEDYSINEVKTIFKESNIDKIREQLGSKKLVTDISKILNKVEYNNDLIYVISYYLKSGNQNDQISVGGEAIAISVDKGKNWKFFEKDDESLIPVLSTKYSNQIITKVLNYEYKK